MVNEFGNSYHAIHSSHDKVVESSVSIVLNMCAKVSLAFRNSFTCANESKIVCVCVCVTEERQTDRQKSIRISQKCNMCVKYTMHLTFDQMRERIYKYVNTNNTHNPNTNTYHYYTHTHTHIHKYITHASHTHHTRITHTSHTHHTHIHKYITHTHHTYITHMYVYS